VEIKSNFQFNPCPNYALLFSMVVWLIELKIIAYIPYLFNDNCHFKKKIVQKLVSLSNFDVVFN
jgi:hypothetical protein